MSINDDEYTDDDEEIKTEEDYLIGSEHRAINIQNCGEFKLYYALNIFLTTIWLDDKKLKMLCEALDDEDFKKDLKEQLDYYKEREAKEKEEEERS